MTDKPKGCGAGCAALALVLCLLAASPAAADTFKPTRLDDPTPGKCNPDDCSLREAVRASNNHNGRDEVRLGRGTYEIQIPTGGDLSNAAGDFNVDDAAVIRGRGPNQTKIDANGFDRALIVLASGATVVEGLTVEGGDAGVEPSHSSDGGGILAAAEKLTLKHVVIRDNEAVLGGGLSSYSAKLLAKDSTITQNAAAEGGGVRLAALFPQPVMALRTSTISGNSASKGGGILADGFHNNPGPLEPVLDVINSTVAGNHTSAEAGGIMADNGATVALDHATVAYNVADDDNTGGGDAGGIYQHSGATFNLDDSVIAQNSVGSSGTGQQCGGSFLTNGSGNIVGPSPGACSFAGGGTIITPDAKLGTLEDNGGPTETIELLTGSPAIGSAKSCPRLDQRGKPRPAHHCDSGAYERKGT